jgi:hypothetical protein
VSRILEGYKNTMRYSVCNPSSVRIRMSLHKKAFSFLPLFAFVTRPCLRSRRVPIFLVRAVRSNRLQIVVSVYVIFAGRKHAPLPNPQILRNPPQRVLIFLLANCFVNMIKEPLRHIACRGNGIVFLPKICVLQDLFDK